MSLENVLKDIREDSVDNPESHEPLPPQVAEDNPEASEQPLFTEEVLDSVQKQHEIISLRKAIESNDTIDKKTAMEVFTMLPRSELYSASRLTEASTRQNRNYVVRAMDNSATNLDYFQECAYLLRNTLETTISKILKLEAPAKVYEETVNDLATRISNGDKPCKIVANNRMIDLYRVPLHEMLCVDDAALDFAPYAGELTKRFSGLYTVVCQNESLLPFSATNVSLEELHLLLKSVTARIRTDLASRAGNYYATVQAVNYSTGENTLTRYFMADCVALTDEVNKSERMLTGDCSLASAVAELLLFLK